MQEVVTARTVLHATATALATVATSAAVAAITLGDVEVRSAVGEALDARIPVVAAPGDALRGACFSLAPDAANVLPALPGATLELRRSASGTRLQVQTKEPVAEPVVGLGIAIACPGSDAAAERKEYSILLDPPRVARGAPTAPAAPTAATATPAIATLAAQPGDTLESLAGKIFPRDRNARRAYLAAIRADNPALANLSDTDPLPADAQVALPDLRTFMKAAPAPRTQVATEEPAAAPAEARAPRTEVPAQRARAKARAAGRAQPASAPAAEALPSAREEAPALAAAERPAPRAERAPRTAAPTRTSEARAGFQLKLSAPVVDLAPSRSMNERQREELRARLALLDADDQTAAMLAMRDSIHRLETQVSELQLRLARTPPAAVAQPEPAPAPPAPRVEAPAPKAELAKTEAAKVEPAKTEAAKVEPAKAEPAKPEPAKPEPTKAVAETAAQPETTAAAKGEPPAKAEAPATAPSAAPPANAETPAPAAASTPPSPSAVHAIPRPAGVTPWYESQWMLPSVLAAMALLLALWLLARRRNASAAEEDEYYAEPANDGQTVMMADDEPMPHREPLLADDRLGAEPDFSVPAPLLATTRIPPEDNGDLRRRYIEERFPEIVNGTLVLSDPASVVNAARLMREDHAAPRAVELLQLAIERDPARMALWLALFEVFRLERLRGEYASLGVRFMERFNGTLEWRKVRYVGRELDPGNPLYEDTETALAFDPAAEGWLQPAPGGADAALAAELRGGLMAGAAVNERDLVADPALSLRKSESFNLA